MTVVYHYDLSMDVPLAITNAYQFDSVELAALIKRGLVRAVVQLESQYYWQAIWYDGDLLRSYVQFQAKAPVVEPVHKHDSLGGRNERGSESEEESTSSRAVTPTGIKEISESVISISDDDCSDTIEMTPTDVTLPVQH